MSLWRIAWSYLWNRKLTSGLTIVSVALAVALIYSVLTLREETRKRFEEEGQVFDMVVGGKGSPLQLVLSSVYFMDQPNENIKLSVYKELAVHPDVDRAFPIGMGDTYKGYRIVGTSRELMDYVWEHPVRDERKKLFVLDEGRFFEKPFEAVIGSVVAESTGLRVGDTFISTHGHIEMPGGHAHRHEKFPYTVVGILKRGGTPGDRAVFCDLQSVWDVHKKDETGDAADLHEQEVTSVLLTLHSPGLRFEFQEYVNDNLNAMAVVPVVEIQQFYEQFLGTAKTVLLAVGYLVVVISALSILIGLYLSILQRKRDLAVMRALGASRVDIVGSVLIEALWVTVLGIAGGYVFGNVVAWGLGQYLVKHYGLSIGLFAVTGEAWASFAIVAVVGLLAGVIPAWQAYQTNVARDLAEL